MTETPEPLPIAPPAFLILPGQSVDLSSTAGPDGSPVTVLAIRNPVGVAQVPMNDAAVADLIRGLQGILDSRSGLITPAKPQLIVAEGGFDRG